MTSHYSVPTKRVQARVLTSCPLCGFKQRIDRLLGVETGLTNMDNLLPMELMVVYADKRASGLHSEREPLKVVPKARKEANYALAAKLLPLVVFLRSVVPEFEAALLDTELVEVEYAREVVYEREGSAELLRERAYQLDASLVREKKYREQIAMMQKEMTRWQLNEGSQPMQRTQPYQRTQSQRYQRTRPVDYRKGPT